MRFIFRVILSFAVLMLVTSRLYASGPIISDPNENGAITAKMYAETDLNLAKKVSYEAKFKPVKQIIDDLGQMTGVKLIAGARDSDWTVRSRKMNIFVKDVPLSELMDSIARTMKFRWSRYDDTKPLIYRLKVDNKAAAESDAMMKLADEKQEAMWQKRRDAWIDAIMKYGAMSDSELSSLKDSNPMIYELGVKRGVLKAIRALFEEVPETKTRFKEGNPFRISASSLSPETSELLFNSGNVLWIYLQKCGFLTGTPMKDAPGYTDEIKYDDEYDIAFIRLNAQHFTPNLCWGSASLGDCGYFHIQKKSRDFEIAGMPSLDSEYDQSRSVAHTRILEGVDVDEAWVGSKEPREKLTQDLIKLEESLYPSEPLIEHAASSDTEKKVKITVGTVQPENDIVATRDYVAAWQKALFDATGIGVVSDSWVNIHGQNLPDQEMTLRESLDKFAENYNYNWDKPESILEFRHRKWAKMRLNQIPDEWIATWDQNTRDNNFLRLDDLAAMSNLKYDQAEESIKPDKLLGAHGMYAQLLAILDDSNIWLRLYSSLTPRQRTIITGNYGLNGFMLTSAQWKLAQPMFDRIGISRGESIMRLVYTVDQVEKSSNASFTEIDLGSGDVDRIWETYLPGYDPAWEAPKPQ